MHIHRDRGDAPRNNFVTVERASKFCNLCMLPSSEVDMCSYLYTLVEWDSVHLPVHLCMYICPVHIGKHEGALSNGEDYLPQ